VLNDMENCDQLQTYRRDKEVDSADKWKILNPGKVLNKRRRKHHWDRVSALSLACVAAMQTRQRFKPKTEVEEKEVVQRLGLTTDDFVAIGKELEKNKRRETRRRKKAKRFR